MNVRVHALLPDMQKVLRSRECEGMVVCSTAVAYHLVLGEVWRVLVVQASFPPKEDGCLRLSVQFACQLRVEWLRQVGSRNDRCIFFFSRDWV